MLIHGRANLTIHPQQSLPTTHPASRVKALAAFVVAASLLAARAALAQSGSVYMGAPVEMATLPNGVSMNASQLGGALGSTTKAVREVAEGVWAVTGYSVVNIYVIRGSDGLIVIDTGINSSEARTVLAEIRKVTPLPVKTIIYSHKHYMAGAGVIAEGRTVAVIGHPADVGNSSVLRGAFVETLPAQYARGAQQMGAFLPHDGPDASAGGHSAGGGDGAPLPITVPARDGAEMIIDGVRMQFFSGNASDDDSVSVWLPDRRIVFNNFYWPVAANLYAPRGDAFRDVRSWIAGLKVIRRLKPQLMLSTHADPVAGEIQIRQTLDKYIDFHQILLDQTLRGMLKGVGPQDIAEFVHVPSFYDDIRDGYGETRTWYPRSIYNQAFGWYSGDAADLNPPSSAFRHKELTRLLGGPAAVLKLANQAAAKHQYAWALELANHAYWANPADPAARAMKARLLRIHAGLTPSSIAHNFYMTQARALEGKGPLLTRVFDPDALKRAPACDLVDQFRVRLVSEKTVGVDGLLWLRIADEGACGLHVRPGLAEFLPDIADAKAPPVAEATLTRAQLEDLFAGKTSLGQLMGDPLVPIKGNRAAAQQIGAVFEVLGTG